MSRRNGHFILIAALTSVLLFSLVFPVDAEIVVTQDKDGKIVVSNNYSSHNPYSKTGPVRFKKPMGTQSVPLQYLTKIKSLSKKYGVMESLIVAVARAESSFNPFAVSRKGAVGLMQLMPETAKRYGVYNRYNAEQNLEAGVRHLKYLFKKYKQNLTLTLAAYNAGEEAVKKYKGVPPYKETRNYIKRVMKFMGKSYNRFFKPKTRQTIYRIVTTDGRIIITDSKPSKVDGKITVLSN